MRVGIIAAARHPLREPFQGGMESATVDLVLQLRALGHQVAVFGPDGSSPLIVDAADRLARISFSAGARADVSTPPGAFMDTHHAYLALMLRLQRTAADRFDVVHDNALHYLTVGMAHSLPVPVVTTLHTPPTTWMESALAAAPTPARGTYCAVSRRSARSWAGLIPALEVVPNGVDTDVFRPGPGGGVPVWSGRLVPEKGADHAIAAARRAGTGLRLAGPVSDPDWFAGVIRPMLGGDIEHVGHLGRHELAAILGEASAALVTPRWEEPYGLVLAEALACGTPVAAYDRGASAELLTSRCGRLAAGDDIGGLARALPDAMTLPRAEARAHAVRHCSSARTALRYAEIYRRVTTGTRPDAPAVAGPAHLSRSRLVSHHPVHHSRDPVD